MAKSRRYYIDVLGAILLIHMIVGHCCQWSNTYEDYLKYSYFLSFFMPWFFFKGGMFFHIIPFKDEVKRSGKRLLIPFIVFSIIGTLILWVKLTIQHGFEISIIYNSIKSLISIGSVGGNLPLWFLPSLFIVRVSFGCLQNICNKSNAPLRKWLIGGGVITLCIAIILLYNYKHLSSRHIPIYISNISSGMIFFALGYSLRNFRYSLKSTLIISLVYLILMMTVPTVVDMRTGSLIMGYFYLWIPTALLGILAFNGIFKHFFDIKGIFSNIGRDTMSYYCLHWCVILLVSFFFATTNGVPNLTFLFSLILANAIALPLLTLLISRSKFSYIIK